MITRASVTAWIALILAAAAIAKTIQLAGLMEVISSTQKGEVKILETLVANDREIARHLHLQMADAVYIAASTNPPPVLDLEQIELRLRKVEIDISVMLQIQKIQNDAIVMLTRMVNDMKFKTEKSEKGL